MKNYRAEIDGVRAIAVLLVVLFHLTLTRFGSGGYIGVDVFFVISGYLITDHLRNDLRNGFGGIVEFYRRRIIRIFPALFAIFFACVLSELILKFAIQLRPFQNALLSSIFFGSNFYLYETTGYFDFRARANPLIHTWSLSIEEQFYIFLPLLLYLFRNKPTRWQIVWLAGITGLSLVASQMFLAVDTRISFYLVPLRAWELLAGSLLSYRMHQPITARRWLAEGLGAAGLLAILYSAVQLNSESPFPGFAALPAVLGTVLLLAATNGQTTFVQRLLACPPMRFIGKISYSLYLWHWPLIVYARYISPLESTRSKVALIAVSLAAATLSWWLIEQPIRRHSRAISKRLAFTVGGAAMAIFAALAVALPAIHAVIWKTNPQAERILRMMENYHPVETWRSGSCFIERVGPADFPPECLALDPHRRNVLLIGDSHGAMLWWGLKNHFTDINFLQATAGSCEPLNHYRVKRCGELMDGVVDGYLSTHKVDAVIVSLFWKAGDQTRLAALISRLQRHTGTVVVFGPNRSVVLPFPEVAARAIYSGRHGQVTRYEQEGVAEMDAAIERATRAAGGRYVSIYRTMCASGCWVLGPNDVPVTFDYDHLSEAGADMLAAALPPAIFAPASPAAPSAAIGAEVTLPKRRVFAPQAGVSER